MPLNCSSLTTLYETATSKQQELDRALAVSSLSSLRTLTKETDEAIHALEKELIPNPEQSLKNYEDMKVMWETLGIVENGKIKGFDGKEYIYPDEASFISRIMEKREIFEEKMKTFENPKFLVVPLAVSIPILLETYSNEIRKRKEELVFSDSTKVPTKDWQPQSYQNSNAPVYIWNEYQKADTTMRYDVTEYEQTSGVSKAEKVAELDGFSILLVEDVSDLPATGTGRGGRKTPPSGTAPNEILKILEKANKTSSNHLKGERGLCLEEYLTYALFKLTESSTVIDNYQGDGKISWLAGNFLSGRVPYGYWRRADCRADVDGGAPSDDDTYCAVRLGVG